MPMLRVFLWEMEEQLCTSAKNQVNHRLRGDIRAVIDTVWSW